MAFRVDKPARVSGAVGVDGVGQGDIEGGEAVAASVVRRYKAQFAAFQRQAPAGGGLLDGEA
ncbi:MAG: hypothetical protein K0R83_1407, partial [Caulobacter sp.]|nr:hypothetical protein [Caulobacter sp.]